MADVPELIIKTRLDTDGIKQGASDLNKTVDEISSKIGFKLGAALSLGAVAAGFHKALDAAEEADKAVKQLNSSMALAGTYSKEASERFQEFSQQLQNTTGVSDDLINSSAALLVSVGRLSGDGLERATVAALDLAKGLQIDVGTAFDMVTKASQGNIGGFSRWGLEVKKGATDAQKFAAALDFINSKFGGMAQSGMMTYTGAVTGLKNAISDFFEEVGKVFTHSPAFIGFIRAIGIEIQKINEKIGSSFDGSMIQSVINFGLAFSYVVVSTLERVSSLIQAIGGTFNYVVYGVFGPLTQGVGFLASKLAELINLVMPSAAGGLASLGDSLQKEGEGMKNFAYGSLAEAGVQIQNVFKGITESTGSASQAIIDFQGNFTTEMEKVADSADTTQNAVTGSIKKVSDNTMKYGSILVSSFSSAMQNMAKNMAAGKGLFHDFGAFILGLLGDLAIQMGTMIMSAGVAALAMKMFDPTGMIVTGAALIAVGSLLKAFFGGGSGDASGALQQQSNMNAGASASAQNDFATQEERVVPNTGIVVNVQGNILDRRASGLAIAEILNEAFDTDGVTVRAVSGVV